MCWKSPPFTIIVIVNFEQFSTGLVLETVILNKPNALATEWGITFLPTQCEANKGSK